MRLLPYHLRLAVRSLRRDPGLSATIVVVLAIAGGIFCTALMYWLRVYVSASPALPTSLHQVEVLRSHEALEAAFVGTNAQPNLVAARQRVSFPVYRTLAGSGLGVPQTGTFRARVLIDGVGDCAGRLPARPRNARFVHADFFAMFALPFRFGGAWARQDDAAGAAVAVLGGPLNDALFGGADSVGRAVVVDGRPFRVVGVVDGAQPFSPEWDRSITGGPQDLLYLPFAEHERLLARPESPISDGPEGPRYADLLASRTTSVSFWIDLPTTALREAYARYLQGALGAGGVPYELRDLARLRRELGLPKSALSFFVFLTFLVLAGAGLVTTRLYLAKGLTRQGELSIFRAVGAPRLSLFVRQLLEALLLSAVAGASAMTVAAAAAFVYNRLVADTDIPLAITPLAFAITFTATVVVGVAAALYPAWRVAARRLTAPHMRS
jgi:putative ABC transport system permease protein